MLDRIRIVLVGTSHPGNIGGVARAMKNMGLSDLVLVNPLCAVDEVAVARASGAQDLLTSARVLESFEEALGECHWVVAASARSRHIPWPLVSPRAAAQQVAEVLNPATQQHCFDKQQHRVALVFGRESTGLTNEELTRCHAHLHIPANPDYSSLNLVAAVQVVVYEMRMKALEMAENQPARVDSDQPVTVADIDKHCREPSSHWGVQWDQPLANQQEMEGFFAHLEQVLVAIDFLDKDNPKQLMPRLRRLFLRSALDKTEVNILRGILKKVQPVNSG